tara:strand:+ start:390 stop:794 length:405 start_codon:yes stop_codon:yes gene_type:complete
MSVTDLPDAIRSNLLMKHNIGTLPNEDTAHYGDCHFWLETDKGHIIDPTPAAMKGKKNYKKFSLNKQKEIYKVWEMRLKARGKKRTRNEFYNEPLDRCCQFNVYAYWYHHKKLKIIIGSLGFTQPNGKIFWEFG